MATASPNVAQYFAVGTSLGAYPISNWRAHELPPSGTPKGSSSASATVSAAGVAAFTGLADDTRYFATDASGTRYVSFSTYDDVPPAQRVAVESTAVTSAYARPGSGRYLMAAGGSTLSSAALGNTTVAAPIWLGEAITFDRIGAEVSVAGDGSAVLKLAIYTSTAGGDPDALLLDAGTVAATTLGAKEITIAQAVGPGKFWLAATCSGQSATAVTIRAAAGTYAGLLPMDQTEAMQDARGGQKLNSTTFAASWGTGSPALGRTAAPKIYLRVA